MSFKLVRPSPVARFDDWSKTASTAYADGDLVQPDADTTGIGFDKCVAASNAILGAVQQAITSTDSDYASTTRLNLLQDEFGEWEADIDAGTITANHEGQICALNDHDGLAVDTDGAAVFLIQRYLGITTKCRGKIIKWVTMGYTTLS